jgi:predicted ABC-type ATPase
VNGEFEEFVREHIDHRESFAIETTLRSDVTFDQVSLARECGFECIMRYVALSEFEMNAARVAARGQLGGHSAPVEQLFRIYEASLANLPRALREMDEVRVYDNSSPGAEPAELMVCIEQSIVRRSPDIPGWLVDALSGTEFALA